jgi:hypothetical protein
MSPILQSLANASAYGYRSILTAVPNSFESIATVTSTGSAGDITFSSIPGTYEHLQIRGILRTNDTGTWNNQALRINSDTGSNYAFHRLYGDGSNVVSGAGTSFTSFNDCMRAAGSGNSSNIYGVAVIDILDYAKTSKYKTIRSFNGGDGNGNGWIGLHSGLWQSTSAITSITIIPSGGTAIQYSTFALYGIKGV